MHPRVFPPLYVNMVAAGEASGTLESVLERLADFMEGQARLKGKVVAALAYPVLMTIIGSVLVSVLMIAVVPKVTSIFDNLGQALPWYTRLLIFVSHVLGSYWWLILALLALGSFLFRRWHRTTEGRLKWDALMIRMPIFGRLNLLVAVARFSRTLSTLLASGVPLLKAMEIGRNVLQNARLETVIGEAIGSIREGESIAEPLKRSGQFPPMVTHMIAVGERSGQLEAMLENVSRAYEADVETRVAALTSLLEPLMIVDPRWHRRLHRAQHPDAADPDECVGEMMRRRRAAEERIFFPWESRGGVRYWLGLGRVRSVLLGLAVVGFIALIGVRERRQAGIRQTRATLLDVRHAVNRFMAGHDGGCPESLAVAAAYANLKEAPRDAWGHPLRLICPGRRDGSRYELMSDGPDGKPGGLDRIE